MTNIEEYIYIKKKKRRNGIYPPCLPIVESDDDDYN